MESNLIPLKQFESTMRDTCRTRAVEIIKRLECFTYIERDRVLFPWERYEKKTLEERLTTNEDILKVIDPEYLPIQ